MTEGKVRLFTALPLPAIAVHQLKDLPQKGLDGRWSAAADYHITLRFLGDLESGRIPELTEALARVRRPPFHVELSGMGMFSMKRQTILWAGVASTRKLTALVGDINEALLPLGFEMPNKPFTPHVTLVRLKNSRGAEDYIRRHENRVGISWQAQAFDLYHSGEPDSAGSRYVKIRSFPLGS